MSYPDRREPKSHWLSDFIFGFLSGAAVSFSFLGWILTCFGWMGASGILLVCVAIGLLFGGRLAYENIKAK